MEEGLGVEQAAVALDVEPEEPAGELGFAFDAAVAFDAEFGNDAGGIAGVEQRDACGVVPVAAAAGVEVPPLLLLSFQKNEQRSKEG